MEHKTAEEVKVEISLLDIFMCRKIWMMLVSIAIILVLAGCFEDQEENLKGLTPVHEFVMNSYFADRMVLQQNQPIIIFGKSEPGVLIQVQLFKKGNNRVVAQGHYFVDDNGDWQVLLPQMHASYQLYTLFISDSVYTKEIQDILIGEVWLTGGEKNMRWPMRFTVGSASYSEANQENTYLRFFSQDQYPNNYPDSPMSQQPETDFSNGRWHLAGSVRNQDTSAIGYIFACELFNSLNKGYSEVPVAFIESAVDESGIHAWLPKEAVDDTPAVKSYLKDNGLYPEEGIINTQGSDNYNQMSVLYNHKISPLAKIHLQGVIWYQGTSDIDHYEYYADALSLLISSWREALGSPLKFVIVQEHSYDRTNLEAFRLMQTVGSNRQSDVVIIPTYDLNPEYLYQEGYEMEPLSENEPYYPINKIELAQRIEKAVLTLVYRDAMNYLPPRNQGYTISQEENKLMIRFSNCQELKIRKDEDPETAPDDQEEPAEDIPVINNLILILDDDTVIETQAVIETNILTITYEDITRVKAVRYCFAPDISDGNLTNELGIPVLPFCITINW